MPDKDAQKQPLSLFDRRRSGRGDNVKFTVDSDRLLAQSRLANVFNDRSLLGSKKRLTPPIPRTKKPEAP
ncbi:MULTISPECIES: hypothetical protein [Streptomyces]|uniref:hypothetical protein n=1 Tax=Streptomyces TaxID=1883 RepID=UPI0004CBF812|nr:hypothetical protein [Streptomyces rimosus]